MSQKVSLGSTPQSETATDLHIHIYTTIFIFVYVCVCVYCKKYCKKQIYKPQRKGE